MCYNRIANLSDYWSNNSSLGNQFIKNAISRNRFHFLMSKLHCNHPEKPDSAAKLYYVEELVNCMKQTFSNSMSESSHQSIDESMAKFKGRSVLKQYLPLKPIKRGIKVWQRCDAKTGYIFDLYVYSGKIENEEFSEGTLEETIKISDVVISFDRFFTSVNLIHTLPFSAVGTVIKSRKNVPKFAKVLDKGESEFLVTSSGLVASRWIDSKEVVVISNCSLPETTSISRKQKDGTRKQFQCPNAIALYNEIMGGIDLSDQKVNVYDLNKKSTKWWKKVFYKIKMSAAINAHILHQAKTKRKTSLLKYLVNLAEQLVLTGRKIARVKRKTNSIAGPRSKRAKAFFNVGDHLPVESQGRRRRARCAQMKTDRRTNYICAACHVPLCQSCFTPYHNWTDLRSLPIWLNSLTMLLVSIWSSSIFVSVFRYVCCWMPLGNKIPIFVCWIPLGHIIPLKKTIGIICPKIFCPINFILDVIKNKINFFLLVCLFCKGLRWNKPNFSKKKLLVVKGLNYLLLVGHPWTKE